MTSVDHQISLKTLRGLHQTKSTELHIISAGPSLRNFNWNKLRGNDVMALNDVIFHLPLRTMYYVLNEPPSVEKEKYKKANNFIYSHKFTTFTYSGWHKTPSYPGKNLSYLLALDLGRDLGYEKLYLYGYDFECIDGFIHWWDKEPEKDNVLLKKKIEIVRKQKNIFDNFIDTFYGSEIVKI